MSRPRVKDPGPKGEPDALLAFLKSKTDRDSTRRRELESRWLESKLMVEGDQWLSWPKGEDPRTTTDFRVRNQSESRIPITTTNEIMPLYEVTRARLSKRKSEPYIRASSVRATVEQKQATTKADDILRHYLDEMLDWKRVRRQSIINFAGYGTSIITVEQCWDQRENVRVPKPDLMRCPDCEMDIADKKLPQQAVNAMSPDWQGRLIQSTELSEGMASDEYEIGEECPRCGGMLEEHQSPKDQKDAFGRDMFKTTPLGNPLVTATSPWDFFVQNEGLGVSPGPLGKRGHPNSYAESYPEDIDILAAYYDTGDKVEPEDATGMAREYPILGEYAATAPGVGGVDARDLWANHATFRRWIQGPTMDFPLGRYIVMGGRQVLANGDLMKPSPDDPQAKIPIVSHHCARYFPIDKEFYGQGMIEPLKSPQRRLNMRNSQIVDNAERSGSDALLIPEDMELLPGWDYSGSGGMVLRWKRSTADPTARPEHYPAHQMASDVWQEIDYLTKRMGFIAGTQASDLDQAVALDTASALQLTSDKDNERREDLEQDLINSYTDSWQAVMCLLRLYVKESRTFWKKGDDGVWTDGQFTGKDLSGLTTVQVEEQPAYDQRVFDRTITLQGIQQGLVPIDTAFARREARRELGINNDVSDQESKQVENFELHWRNFSSQMVVPPVELTQQDHKTGFEVLGLALLSEEGLALKEAVHWNDVLPAIAGWRKEYDQAVATQAEFEQWVLSGGPQAILNPPPPMTGNPAVDGPAQQAQAAQSQQAQKFGQYTPPPEAIEKHIYLIMKTRVSNNAALIPGLAPQTDELGTEIAPAAIDAQKLDLMLQFEAVVEAHSILAEQKMAASMAAPVTAAPGAEQTPGGSEPNPTDPATQPGQL